VKKLILALLMVMSLVFAAAKTPIGTAPDYKTSDIAILVG